ncbi:MAG: DUF21 domain-containing protein [Planctomycetes bacterium]|nr:DUF21 domain-containing protein [Planctomycetota bacterium]
MIIAVVIMGVVFSIVLSGFFSGFETAIYRASPLRMRALADSGDHRASVGLTMIEQVAAVVTTTLIGNNLAVYMATYILTSYFERTEVVSDAEMWATVVLTPLCFIFAETLPKRMANMQPDTYLLAGTRVAYLSQKIFYPLGFVLGAFGKGLRNILIRMGYKPARISARARLLEYFEASVAEELLSDGQHQMMQKILSIQEQSLRSVMVPLQKAFTINEDETCASAARKMFDSGRHRAPLTDRSGQLTGRLITFNDILRTPNCSEQPVNQISRPMMSLDANTKMSKAMHKMRLNSERMAIVRGKGNQPIGLTTVSDLLSRIVGAMKL